jgi:hypothetical protein
MTTTTLKPVRARLAKNLHCEFHFDPDANGIVNVEWDPRAPSPMPRQLMRRYMQARDNAYRALAARKGGVIMVVNTTGGGTGLLPVISLIHPDGRIERRTLDDREVH